MTDSTTDPQQPTPGGFSQQLSFFARQLRELRIACGNPPLREVEKAAPSARPLSASAVSEALAGKRLPRLDFLIALIQTLHGLDQDGHTPGRDDPRVKQWRARWENVERARVNARLSPPHPRQQANLPMPPVTEPGEPVRQSASVAEETATDAYSVERGIAVSTSSVLSAAFSPDGRLLAAGGDDDTMRLWNQETKVALAALQKERDELAYRVAALTAAVTRAENRTEALVRTIYARLPPKGLPLADHAGSVISVAFSPDGHLLAAASKDGSVRLWNPATGRRHGRPLTGHTGSVRSVAFSPDGHLLAISDARTVRLVDPSTGQAHGDPLTDLRAVTVYSVAFSPDGRLLAAAGEDGTVRMWDPSTGRVHGRHPLPGHAAGVYSVAFSPDGRLFAVVGQDGSMRFWDPSTGDAETRFFIGAGAYSVAFSFNGSRIATAGWDGTVGLWDLSTGGSCSALLRGHVGSVRSVAFSPDGRRLASAGDDGTVRLWDLLTGLPHGAPLRGHVGSVRSVAFSPDGRMFASAGDDGTVRLWPRNPFRS